MLFLAHCLYFPQHLIENFFKPFVCSWDRSQNFNIQSSWAGINELTLRQPSVCFYVLWHCFRFCHSTGLICDINFEQAWIWIEKILLFVFNCPPYFKIASRLFATKRIKNSVLLACSVSNLNQTCLCIFNRKTHEFFDILNFL